VPNDDAAERTRLRDAILRYLDVHPLAGDTAEGILASWLPVCGFETAPDHIEAVLAELVSSRRLEARRLPDATTLYVSCVDPSKE
jgi:hypothetical protein